MGVWRWAVVKWLVVAMGLSRVEARSYTFLEQALSLRHFNAAVDLSRRDLRAAIAAYRDSYDALPTIVAAENMIWIFNLMARRGDADSATKSMLVPLAAFQRSQVWFDRGMSLTLSGNESEALVCYLMALNETANRAEVWFHVGTTRTALGDLGGSVDAYRQALRVNPIHTKSIINLATLFHRSGELRAAEELYQRVVSIVRVMRSQLENYDFLPSDYTKTLTNLAMVRYQLGQHRAALELVSSLEGELQVFRPRLAADGLREVEQTLQALAAHRLLVQRAVALWRQREELVTQLVARGPLLPFDSLLYDLPLPTKYRIAVRAAAAIIPQTFSPTASPNPYHRAASVASLRVGILTADIADHPTAHLLEGLLRLLRNVQQSPSALSLLVFSYGPPNNSSCRAAIHALCDVFVDLSRRTSRAALAQELYAHELDILLDMQVFTLGHQLEVVAARPPQTATINYLVYPGTSGAAFLDYIAVDAVVAPPEHAAWYSERLLLLPPTYQPSHYPVLPTSSSPAARRKLRSLHGLPEDEDAVVLCNFNKIDKLDPASFGLWMDIMRREPRSVLWLLHPAPGPAVSTSDAAFAVEQLPAVMRMHGVASERLVLAPWTSKAQHVQRHLAADLFLDTVAYGAHSTATDALHGGLPVLTLKGDAFSNRVAASLLEGLGRKWATLLVVESAKDYVATAARLLARNDCGERLVHALRRHLLSSLEREHVTTLPPSLPPTQGQEQEKEKTKSDVRRARCFVAAMQAVHEVSRSGPVPRERLPHLVMAPRAPLLLQKN